MDKLKRIPVHFDVYQKIMEKEAVNNGITVVDTKTDTFIHNSRGAVIAVKKLLHDNYIYYVDRHLVNMYKLSKAMEASQIPLF